MRRSDQGRSTGKDSEIGKLEQQVAELRRRHDDVRNQCQFRQKDLDTMQDKLKDLEKEMSKLKDDDTPDTWEMENGEEIDVMVEQTGGYC